MVCNELGLVGPEAQGEFFCASQRTWIAKEHRDFSREHLEFSKENRDFSRENLEFSKENRDFSRENGDFPKKMVMGEFK